MTDGMFVMMWLAFQVMVVFLMRAIGLSMARFSVPSFVILSMIIFSYVGLLPLYFGFDEYRYLSGVQDQERVLLMSFFSALTILIMVIGFAVAQMFWGSPKRVLEGSLRKLSGAELGVLFVVFLVCVFVLIIYLGKVPRVAIVEILTDGVAEAKVARSAMSNDFGGKYHWYALFMYEVLNFVLFSYFAHWLVRGGFKTGITFLLILCVGIFSAIMTTQKSMLAWLMIGLFLVYVTTRNEGCYPLRSVVKLGVGLLAVLILAYIVIMGADSVGSALTAVFSRAFTGQITPAYFYLEYFPDHHEFLWGRSFPNPGGLLPHEPFRLSVEVMNWKFPDLAEKGIVGSAPTVFWGEMYANFGVLGIIFPPAIVGVYLYGIAFLVHHLENTPIKVGFTVWLALHFKNLAATGLSTFIIDFELAMVSFILVGILAVGGRGRIRLNRGKLERMHAVGERT